MSATNDYYPVLRCICGREVVLYGETATCQCGIELSIKTDKHQSRAWAVAPDDYDLSTRRINKPELARWKKAK